MFYENPRMGGEGEERSGKRKSDDDNDPVLETIFKNWDPIKKRFKLSDPIDVGSTTINFGTNAAAYQLPQNPTQCMRIEIAKTETKVEDPQPVPDTFKGFFIVPGPYSEELTDMKSGIRYRTQQMEFGGTDCYNRWFEIYDMQYDERIDASTYQQCKQTFAANLNAFLCAFVKECIAQNYPLLCFDIKLENMVVHNDKTFKHIDLESWALVDAKNRTYKGTDRYVSTYKPVYPYFGLRVYTKDLKSSDPAIFDNAFLIAKYMMVSCCVYCVVQAYLNIDIESADVFKENKSDIPWARHTQIKKHVNKLALSLKPEEMMVIYEWETLYGKIKALNLPVEDTQCFAPFTDTVLRV